MQQAVDRVRQACQRAVKPAAYELQFVAGVKEKPSVRRVARPPCVERTTLRARQQRRELFAAERFQRHEESGVTVGLKAPSLFTHLASLAATSLRKQHDSPVLQKLKPSDGRPSLARQRCLRVF